VLISHASANFEMTDGQHRELADALASVRGMVAVSKYHAPLLDRLYPASKWWKTVSPLPTNHSTKDKRVVLAPMPLETEFVDALGQRCARSLLLSKWPHRSSIRHGLTRQHVGVQDHRLVAWSPNLDVMSAGLQDQRLG
jgi:hypothetical protein